MRVQIIKTGEIQSVEAAYGVRLIEQGKAILSEAKTADATIAHEPAKQDRKPEAKNAGGK